MAVAAPPKSQVTEFAERVVGGDLRLNRLGRLACERHLRDLKDGHERGLWFDGAHAERVIGFFGFLIQRKGEWGGMPLKLAPWQAFRIGCAFGWKRADGTRRFRVAYNEEPRKNGKTTEAAGVGLYLAFFDGEPGAEVYATATKREQAKICWSEAKWMATHKLAPPKLRQRIRALVANLHDPVSASKFEPLGCDKDGTDGLNIHGLVLDELHAWKDREYWAKLDTAMGSRRQPLTWIITTPGYDKTSICWEQHQYAVNILEGVFEDDSYFAYIATVDDPAKWEDEEQWWLSNPNLEVSKKLDYMREKYRKATQIPSEMNNFLRYELGMWTEQENRFISLAMWDAQKPRCEPKDLLGRKCFIGVDLASTTDLAAVAYLFPDDDGEGCDLFVDFYVPEDGLVERSRNTPYSSWVQQGFITATPGPVIDYDYIEEAIKARIDEWQCEPQTIAKDPWNAVQFGTHMTAAGFTVVDVMQNFVRLNAPTNEMDRLLILENLRHGGNTVLRWMAANAVALVDSRGNKRLDKEKSGEKIDGLAATVNAIEDWLKSTLNSSPSWHGIYIPSEEQ